MSFDKPTRNKLANMVGDCRRLLTDDIRHQLQSIYGLQPDGSSLAVSSLTHLDERGRDVAGALRLWQEHLASTEHGTEVQRKEKAFERLAHETAFTVLNRMAALRMCEERGHVIECVRRGMESDGFVLYERFSHGVLGGRGETYRIFLERMFAELAVDLGALFDLDAPQSLIFPRERCLEDVLSLLNKADLAHLWEKDETIGWIYQYFNSKEEREAMREASAAPRNSRELAVRNQFFTPRYVVEFLVDNTLGRIWYEMRKGNTALKDTCRYLVRRSTEIFLNEGEQAPTSADEEKNLSHEQPRKQPLSIPHRPNRDPRDMKILDPACGSGHFLLYAFDLLETIYEEAWREERPTKSDATGKTLREEYADVDILKRALPELILRNNLHGIDIDLRACQIAALALWLRAQRAYQHLGLRPAGRPKITKSNIVCAEPMPGERKLLDQFVADLQPKALGQLVQVVFEKMKLAGEAGSLLRIEDEIAGAVADAKKKWLAGPKPEQTVLFGDLRPEQTELRLDFSGITEETFWERAEERIYTELQNYAERAENGQGYQRRLFSEDTVKGFAFIDLCRQHYDVVLMNPPFGDASVPSKPYLDETYGDTKGDVYKAFVECFQGRLAAASYLGVISSRTGFFLGQSVDWRERVVLRLFRPIVLADLGMGVLDAMVEVAAYVLRTLTASENRALTLSLLPRLANVELDEQKRFSLAKWQTAGGGLRRHQAVGELARLESAGFIQPSDGNSVRYSPISETINGVVPPPEVNYPPLICFRILRDENKGEALTDAICDPASQRTFVCDPGNFSYIPGNTFAYWCPERILDLFSRLPSLSKSGRKVRTTNPTCDDFRFARTWWEPKAGYGSQWRTWNKGGGFSPFYRDIDLVIDWDDRRNTYRGYLGTIYRPDVRPANLEYFSRPGLTWVYRGHRLCIQAMPEGTVISKRGSGIYAEEDVRRFDLGLLNSTMADYLIKLTLGRNEHPQFDVGDINTIPIPPLDMRLSELAVLAWAHRRELDTSTETSHAFARPALLKVSGQGIVERSVDWSARIRAEKEAFEAVQREIDDLVFRLYDLNTADRSAVYATLGMASSSEVSPPSEGTQRHEGASPEALVTTGALFSYLLGVSFGRWDIRLATDGKTMKQSPDPFAPLPVCPPGMLLNRSGLPMTREDIKGIGNHAEWNYPLEIQWDGILVDDEDSPNDIIRHLREVLRVIWKERADLVEQESCEILGIKDLREYFRKPSLFFADHLKTYSKSGRQAPIYWPLSTASGSYTLWLYYQGINDDSLYTALNRYVKPKIDATEKELRRIEGEMSNAMGRDASALRVVCERTTAFLDELREFRDNVARVAELPYRPSMNDGVLISASPLWKLFRLPKWRKDLEECWKKLEAGDYDWAHLAYSIWPDRVREVCKSDRSIAIAHDLESLCEAATKPAKKKRSKKIVSQETIEETVPGDEE